MDRERAQLVGARAARSSATVRTCDGCGLCCTEAYNSVRILPIEAERIARHLDALAAAPARGLARPGSGSRSPRSASRPRLDRQPYTCPFLEPDFTCALPFDVKPVACLAFNPVTDDHCEMDVDRFDRAHAPRDAAGTARAGARPARFRSRSRCSQRDRGRAEKAAAGRRPGRGAKGPARRPASSKPHPLPRVLSKGHVASSTEAEALVRAGRVTVNGTIVRDVLRFVRSRNATASRSTASRSPRLGPRAYVVRRPQQAARRRDDDERSRGAPTVMDLLAGPPAPGLAPSAGSTRTALG